MTCSKYPPMLSRLLDRELSSSETAEVEDHLTQCENCRALLEHWQLQGTHLRSHLGRHVLGDGFVRKVLPANPLQERGTGKAIPRARGGYGLVRWLPAAAVILAAMVVLSQFFSSRDGVGYAKVIDPGELEVLQSAAWVRATAGELLHPGDWLRNPMGGAPEILWRDSCRLTLDAGTLAHFPDNGLQSRDQVVLMSGALLSEIQTGAQDFQVRTPAGSVTSSAGRFTVRVTQLSVPQLEVAADRLEILTGTVVSIGEVSVQDGKVRIEAAQGTREVPAGETAVFTETPPAPNSALPKAVEASLRVVAGASGRGALSSSLTADAEGLCLEVEAANISLKKLLEWSTAAEVRGGEDTNVAGSLRFLANSRPQSVASSVGTALGLPISFRQEKAFHAMTAGPSNPTPTPDWIKGSFSFERSQNGLISFDFRAMPAGRAFQILRSAVTDLPGLAAEAEGLPITLHASALNPAEATAWIGKALGLQIKKEDHQVGIIEIGSPAIGAPEAHAPSTRNEPQDSTLQASPVSTGAAAEFHPGAAELSPSAAVPRSLANTAATFVPPAPPPVVRHLWSVLGGSMSAAGSYNRAPLSGDTSVIKGKISLKTRELFGIAELIAPPRPSLHLIWPVLGLEGSYAAEAAYLVTNHMGLPAHTLWSGYNCEGQLIAQIAILVNGSSTLSVLPSRDLPACLGPGGHWETLSNLYLVGSRESEQDPGTMLGLPMESERVIGDRSFPLAWFNQLGVSLWLANPAGEDACVELALMSGKRVFSTERVTIPAHGGMLWTDVPSGNAPGLTVAVRVSQGSVATGLK